MLNGGMPEGNTLYLSREHLQLSTGLEGLSCFNE